MAKEFSYEQLRNALKILKLPADFNNSVLRAHADYANEQAREKAATEAEPEPHQPAAMLPHPSASVLPNIPAAMLPHPSVAVLPNLLPAAMLPHPSAAVLQNPPNNCQQGNIQPGYFHPNFLTPQYAIPQNPTGMVQFLTVYVLPPTQPSYVNPLLSTTRRACWTLATDSVQIASTA